MQSNSNSRMSFKALNEGTICALIAGFKHMLEISDRLVGMKQQRQMEFYWHGDFPGFHP